LAERWRRAALPAPQSQAQAWYSSNNLWIGSACQSVHDYFLEAPALLTAYPRSIIKAIKYLLGWI
jgi:hypothetical protein